MSAYQCWSSYVAENWVRSNAKKTLAELKSSLCPEEDPNLAPKSRKVHKKTNENVKRINFARELVSFI